MGQGAKGSICVLRREVAAAIAGLFEVADETAAMYLNGVRAQAESLRQLEAGERAS